LNTCDENEILKVNRNNNLIVKSEPGTTTQIVIPNIGKYECGYLIVDQKRDTYSEAIFISKPE